MYRNYENVYKLEEILNDLRREYNDALEGDADEETLYDLYCAIENIKERINFAWQDDEYDSMCADYADELWIYENTYA